MTIKIDRFQIHESRYDATRVEIWDFLTNRCIISFETPLLETNRKLAELVLEKLNQGIRVDKEW